MKQEDILSKYIESLTTGLPDNQAQLFARSWAEASEIHPDAATKPDLELSIEKVNSSIAKLYLVTVSIFLVLVVEVLKGWVFK